MDTISYFYRKDASKLVRKMAAMINRCFPFYIMSAITVLMVPAHFHDVDGDLSDHNVGRIFGLFKILTVVL